MRRWSTSNERVLTPITKDKLYLVRGWRGIPAADVGAERLWFRRQDLDAFLVEVGPDPDRWLED